MIDLLTFQNGYSPALSLFTAAAEISIAIWAWRGEGRRDIVQPLAYILLLLAGYQLAEVFVCSRPTTTIFARFAFADVIWLPPLGVYLVAMLSGSKTPKMKPLAGAFFAGAGVLTAVVLLVPEFVTRAVCEVVIAKYSHQSGWYLVYGSFYQLGLGAMLFGGAAALATASDPIRRRHLADLQLGTLGFVLPALLTPVALPGLDGAMPSIMCHYGLVLAAFLARIVWREQHLADLANLASHDQLAYLAPSIGTTIDHPSR